MTLPKREERTPANYQYRSRQRESERERAAERPLCWVSYPWNWKECVVLHLRPLEEQEKELLDLARLSSLSSFSRSMTQKSFLSSSALCAPSPIYKRAFYMCECDCEAIAAFISLCLCVRVCVCAEVRVATHKVKFSSTFFMHFGPFFHHCRVENE